MNRNRTLALLLILLAAALLAGCAGKSGAEQAVESYYGAILAQDAGRLATLTCAGFEETAITELDSFNGVEIALDGLTCAERSNAGGVAEVTCQGKIVASYGNEKMEFPLAERVHSVQNEGGDWRVCGY
jgi:hypothetical protein